MKRLLLYFLPWKCRWHKYDTPVTYDPDGSGDLAYCPECGTMLDTKICGRCGKDFLDWEAKGFDDVIAAPTVTESGDLICIRCAQRNKEEEELEAENEPDYGLYPS